MELVEKHLKLAIADERGERTLLLDKDRDLVTYGTSPKATINAKGPAIPDIAKLIEKEGDTIDLYIDEPLNGFIKIGEDKLSFNDLVESGIISRKNARPYISLLNHYTGFIETGQARVIFGFEDMPSSDGIPTKFLHPLSPKRLKQFKGPYAKSFLASAILHLTIVALIFLLPRPQEMERFIRKYIAVKTTLKPIAPKEEKEPKAQIKKLGTSKEGTSLLAMIDSRKRLKGFVRNLYFSKADTIQIGGGETQAPVTAGKGGLFTRIGKTELKKEEIGEAKPLFASAAASRLSKEGGITFVESSLETGTPEIEGTLNRETISETVSQGEGALRYCYEEALIRRPDIKGRIVVLIRVAKEGGVDGADIESSSLNDRPFELCILKKIRAWKFPKAEGTVTIKHPFVFYTTRKG